MMARCPGRVSAVLAAVERVILSALVLAIAGLVLMNVLLRLGGITIAWADEMAVYAMILSGFVGASLMLRARIDPAVLLLHEIVPDRVVRGLRALVSLVALGFGLGLCHLCWRWFDPLALAASGFDIVAFEAATFNFIYTDTTPVTAIPSFWLYLIMPWFALCVSVHAAANLVEELGLATRPDDPAGLGMRKGMS